MERIVKFAVDEVQRIDFNDFDDEEFAMARLGFLSTRPNSHGLIISEDVLRNSAPSVLNKWVVADMFMGEPTSHTSAEHIVGRIPRSQKVEFVEDDDGYLRAYVDAVISKVYAKDFCEAFSKDPSRSVSVEMKVSVTEEDEDVVTEFNIVGVTVLGKMIKPSCPESNITFVKFSKSDADKFFKSHQDTLKSLKEFAQERKSHMEEKKTYKVDKSKEAMSDADWGKVDKAELRDKIMGLANRAELVKDVYLLVEDGWEDAPSEHLKYPVMMFDGDTLVYNRGALSAALAYAKQHDEQSVVDKVEKIYKELDLTDSDGKEETKMEEVKDTVMAESVENLSKEEVVEEPKQEEQMAEQAIDAQEEQEQEHGDDCDCDACMRKKLSAKVEELKATCADKDNIIMDKDAELAKLRQFKADVEAKEKAMSVEAIMAEVKGCFADEQYEQFKQEGLECKMSELDGWANKVKSVAFTAMKKPAKKGNSDVWSFAAPVNQVANKKSIWD